MRIAYISHVDSRWIKQRPHFIAEALNRPGVRVIYVCSLLARRRLLVGRQRLSIPVVRLPLLPQRWRARLGRLDFAFSTISALLLILLMRPNAAIVTHSRHRRLAAALRIAGVRIFYDCMDLNNLFDTALDIDKAEEAELLDLVEKVFCSSEPIADHVKALAPTVEVLIVPNALDPLAFAHHRKRPPRLVENSVGYVGAISSWFDFDGVNALLAENEDVVVHLWGPADVEVPDHARIVHHGVVTHRDAVGAMHRCSVLILPFHVNDLIRAVDPVKVYEYIASGRPVVACSYPVLDHFGDFIRTYKTTEEFVRLVSDALDGRRVEDERVGKFVSENSWDSRADVVASALG